jgi:hypothetical protein
MTVYTGRGLSLTVFSGEGATHIANQVLDSRSMSKRKAEIILRVFDNGRRYDFRKFFEVWIAIKNFRIPQYIEEGFMDYLVQKWRAELEDKK